MKDDTKAIADDVRASAELEPIVQGVNKIADNVVQFEKRLKSQIEEVDKKAQQSVATLEDKANKSIENIIERVADLRNRTSAFDKALAITSNGSIVRDMISPETKMRAGMYEQVAEQYAKTSAKTKLADPEICMAVTDWMRYSTKSQCGKFASEVHKNSEARDKMLAALNEYHQGPNWQAKAALQEDTGAEGGNLVPTIVQAEILRKIQDAGDIFPRCRQLVMTSKVHNIPSEKTATSVGWAAEEGALTGTEPTFAQVTLTAKKLYGRATASIELVQDSAPGLLAWLLDVFTERMAGELDYQVVLGNASSPVITGIMSASGINAITSATAAGRALTYALLVQTFAEAGEKSSRSDAYWIVSKQGYVQMLALADTTGQPIVKFGTVESAPAGTILGRPVIVSNRLGGAGTAVHASLDDSTNTATKILFGPLMSVMVGTRQGFRWEVTDQVSWANYRIDARLTGRFGIAVGIPSNFTYLGQVAY